MFIEQLLAAWYHIRCGSRSAGVDGITVDLFAASADSQIQMILNQIQQQSYHASPAKGFYVTKKNGAKRLVGIPTVRDRIVQRLLLEEMYLPLENAFLDCSYAYRPGRSIQKAVQHLYGYYQSQPKWIIKADIANFFDNICHALLLTVVDNLKLEPILMQLLQGQVKAGVVIGGQTIFQNKGVLQGGILSGALANLYLTYFDQKCLDHRIKMVRYGDDFSIACDTWREANQILDKVTHWLGELYLHLQTEKTQIYASHEEFIFLGHRFANGKVYAPPPPDTKRKGEWTTTESGYPYFRPKARELKFESRFPKACDISKPSNLPKAPTTHLWHDSMSTLYVSDQGAHLSIKNHQFQVYYQGELRIKIPATRVSSIVLFGCCNVSHGAVTYALRRRIPIIYLSQKARYYGRYQAESNAKIKYLIQQVMCSQKPEFIRKQAESIVWAKLHNSRALLLKLNRRRPSRKAASAIDLIANLMDDLPQAESIDALRGYEGKGATLYFQALGSLFTGVFAFDKRTKRPPTDPINSLMSLGYTLLSQNIFSLIQAVGLHAHFGNLHVPDENHPALVSDLIEEFRAQLVDSLIAYLINSKIFTPEEFTPPDEKGGVYLQPHSIKKFLKHWEEKLQSEITHPHTGYQVNFRRCIELQVWEYVACLMGEIDVYRPMVWKL
ncbi:hypothetical protein DSM106972_047720 [Dulcicalothrix desertica PCC 7102]|uniref:CRISPR-associated endonuclease Cas1 n=1 Tax=Dulcicalothrix desertica PCC 7102 TaxID=232991 RepID=A0A3S1B310_9CYAN|nr:CRISPR-associated endonuclease Cas1 [Dulcicalothrix desertica]RUT03858.1 hypothetical protein DSM106972_047720 [Dulcicalothrix desertica PCC 7102]TWH43731.1 CRISPR-associated endonuclease Cas1/group II intron reverse transcriptase/maturase,TIGR04416 [Dulcicalothrix desertica PCC 7102]